MSCQQATPRITEDPYVFTETTPTTATLYNPQIHKLSPIISNTQTIQKQLVTTRTPFLANTKVGTVRTQTHQIVTNRINGVSHIVNGVSKNVIENNATASTIIKNQSHHIQYSPGKIATATTTIPARKFLSPTSPPTLATVHQNHHQQFTTITKPTIISAPTTSGTSLSLPPLFQRNALVTHTTNTVTPIDVNNAIQRNHSVSYKPPPVTGIRPQQIFCTNSVGIVQQQAVNPGVAAATPGVAAKKPHAEKGFPVPANEVRVGQENDKRKSSPQKQIFVTPAKRESRALSTSGKKTRVQSSPNVRTKRSYSQTSHHEALQRISSVTSSITSTSEWHAPDSYIFDNASPFSSCFNLEKCDSYEVKPCVQSNWLQIADIIKCIPTSSPLTRDQRIELRKAQLRRQAMQYFLAQSFRTPLNARRRLICVSKALQKHKNREEPSPPKKCCYPSCVNNALALTAYCYLHITRNTDQFLFLPCTAKFSDNSQCRIPVFDISHELPLCREHAWKRDNYNRIVQEQKPKKPPRKRPKPSAMTRPQKRNKKKRKSLTASMSNENSSTQDILQTKISYQVKSDDSNCPVTQLINPVTANHGGMITQDMLNVCENSSAYESSEDTGVGGLSETELIVAANDVIEEIPLGDTRLLEEHDLTNVLNQLPVDAFNELFTTVQQNGPLEPTQEEQEDLERALEAVNKQVKSLQQMTGGDSNFLGDFLDVDDQILDGTDICTEVLHSSDTSGIDTSNVLVDGGSNSTASCSTTTEIRELVQA